MDEPDKRNTKIALINVSGPYAVGKDSILTEILVALGSRGYRVGTVTTRPVSPDLDPSYISVSPEEFEKSTSIGAWLINSQLAGKVMYGTSIDEIDNEARNGRVGTLTVYGSPAGAGRLREAFGSRLLSLGVLATGGDERSETSELERRLRNRGRDEPAALAARLAHQVEQINYVKKNSTLSTPDGPMHVFDLIVVNDQLPAALSSVMDYMRLRRII